MDFPILFYVLIPIVALLYSSVGHGGASGYLALMALFGINTIVMKPTALILNLFVAGISFVMYYRKGYFSWKVFLPFALASVPAAFLGGDLELEPSIYKKILGVLLIFSVFRLMGWIGKESSEIKESNFVLSLAIGFVIGFFSGLIGIGGGIILSPVILIFHWADMKSTAAISALFIWINSFSGLIGMMVGGWSLSLNITFIVALAIIGGLFGSYLGSSKLDNIILRRVLAVVLIMASAKLIIT